MQNSRHFKRNWILQRIFEDVTAIWESGPSAEEGVGEKQVLPKPQIWFLINICTLNIMVCNKALCILFLKKKSKFYIFVLCEPRKNPLYLRYRLEVLVIPLWFRNGLFPQCFLMFVSYLRPKNHTALKGSCKN